ncbi:MAG TPA: 7,8-didemethyl-8-hydroxy-5-deazariboflavin synthase subunit CofH, partial [Methanolinea sp.]|nr:7,8-didemethyl-8-hydroxy-5-deazariboflavin synthase subunit CofH [Methanolinea sp.]
MSTGSTVAPAFLTGRTLHVLLGDIRGGHRLTPDEAAALLKVRGRDVWRVANAADEQRERVVGDA